ncbi:MAG: hypothetical protein COB02_06230 [Candidatus Cloacimonadota bacterium]|nr:MAG: hypothetical protein COB02_06230 [Candidatus Cloacimonadota bacterium]
MNSVIFTFTYFLLTFSFYTTSQAESDIFADFESRYKKMNKTSSNDSKKSKKKSFKVAILDLKLALLLHPLMKDYDFEIHSFIKPIPKNLNVPINFYLKNRVKESKAMVLKSKLRYKELMHEQITLQQKISSLVFNKNREIRKVISSNDKNVDQALENYRRNYQKKLKNFQLRKLGIIEDVRKTFTSSYGIHYMGPVQRDKKLKKIEKEIFKSAKKVLKAKGFSILLNGNFLEDIKKEAILKLAWVGANFNGVNALNFYLQRQHQVIDDEVQSYSKQNGSELFHPFYKNFNKIPAIFGKNYNNHLVLLGGSNITKATLQVLYKQYDKQDVINDILGFIQHIKASQHE